MKTLLASVAFSLIFSLVQAQFEVKAGASLYPNDYLTRKIYPLIGVGYNQRVGNKFSLRYEALFTNYESIHGRVSNEFIFPFTSNYLIVPKLSLHAGLQYSVSFDSYQSDIGFVNGYQTKVYLITGIQYGFSNRMSFSGRYIIAGSSDHFQIGITYHSKQVICKGD